MINKRSEWDKNMNGFTLSREKIKETYNLSPKMKLTWLEEANKFINKLQSSRKIKCRKKN